MSSIETIEIIGHSFENRIDDEYFAYIKEKVKPNCKWEISCYSKSDKKNNIVTFNFYTENLKDEYERIKKLKICDVSEVMYVNIVEPYYYFNVSDPDGNLLEICSDKYE